MGAQAKSDIYQEMKEALGLVPAWVKTLPESALAGFWGLMRDFYFAETKIPPKYKELIGIAVSGATRCKYCQLFHIEGARLHGATDAEIAEAGTMAGLSMMASTYINAMGVDYEQFARETHEIVAHAKAQMAKQGHGR
jgi:AhpD family alkylhydroperoxidase